MDEQLKKDFEEAKKSVCERGIVEEDNRTMILSALIIRQGLLEVAKSNEKVVESNEKIAKAIESAGNGIRDEIPRG
ncbi:MAG: hypothetical protein Q8N63_05075 [Nanoarchaeota archaeon]|nr:hypothetical protein [Nanoarchaeota archaeon]